MAEKVLNISWNLTGCITSACVAPHRALSVPLIVPRTIHARSHARS